MKKLIILLLSVTVVSQVSAKLSPDGQLAVGATGIYGALIPDAAVRYFGDRADVARLRDPEYHRLRKTQRGYEWGAGNLREALQGIGAAGVAGVGGLGILDTENTWQNKAALGLGISALLGQVADIGTRFGTDKFFNLSRENKHYYQTGLAHMTPEQQAELLKLQRQLRALAGWRAGAQAAGATSMGAGLLPAGSVFGGKNIDGEYRASGRMFQGPGFMGSMTALIAQRVLSIVLRLKYARWVKKLIAQGKEVVAQQLAAE